MKNRNRIAQSLIYSIIVFFAVHLPVVQASLHPSEDCKKQSTTPSLENTYWKLIELDGNAVEVLSKEREPHLQLNPSGKRVQGSGGCNRLVGSYELDGENLRFSKIAGTRMTCPKVMDQEQAFLKALESTTRYQLSGELLSFYAGNDIVARFKAQRLK